jgi:hypothetical protein
METTKTRISDEEISEWITGDEASRYDEIETAIEFATSCMARRDVDLGNATMDVAVEDDDGLVWVWSHNEATGEWMRSDEPLSL